MKDAFTKAYIVLIIIFISGFITEHKLFALPPSHDPTELVKEDGRYYSFNTGYGIWVMSSASADFTNYQGEDPVFDYGTWPSWIDTLVSGFAGTFWAPAIIKMNNKWHLYYSCSTFGSQYSAIGLATCDTLSKGNWEDQGMVTYSDPDWSVNAIDADIFKDESGKVWLLYGSYWAGIVMTELDSVTGKPLDRENITNVANSSCEASHMISHDGYYYLFFNRGSCCSALESTYRIMMGRSKNPTGPFYDKDSLDCADGGGSLFMHSDGRYIGPGHFGLCDDTLLSYHYYDGQDNGSSYLKVSRLVWEDEWPIAEYEVEGGIENDTFAISNVNAGKIIEVEDVDTSNGANVALATETIGALNQQWIFEYLDNTFYKITPVFSPDKALEIADGSQTSGANAQIGTYTGASYQQWYIAQMGNYYRIANRESYQVLEIVNAYTDEGSNAQQWPFNGNDCQLWYIQDPITEDDDDDSTSAVLENTTGIAIYPNPSTGIFSIMMTDGNTALQKVSIFTLNGQKVFEAKLSNTNEFVLGEPLQKGVYIVQVYTAEKPIIEKLVIE